MTGVLTPLTLVGERVVLEPLGSQHLDDLLRAATLDRSTYAYTRVPDGIEAMRRWADDATAERAEGQAMPFAVIDRSIGVAVGTTRLFDWAVLPGDDVPSDAVPPTVSEIGHTWYGASAQRTGVNIETKLLLLTQAFDVWPGLRVTLKTDARNRRSFHAIERLGAHFEGIRRAHMAATDGTVRDTAYFSIVAEDWPEVRAGLLRRLTR